VEETRQHSAVSGRRGRLNQFLGHLALYFVATVVGLALALRFGETILIAVLFIWGVGVAAHAAWVMGLWGSGRR